MNLLDRVCWIDLPSHTDPRGTLTAIEGSSTIPFEIRRVFYLTEVTADRAGHAHRDTQQVLIGVAGSLCVEVSDGSEFRSFRMHTSREGLYVPPMVFVRLKEFSSGAVLLALASTPYDPTKSIRSWDEYLVEMKIPAA